MAMPKLYPAYVRASDRRANGFAAQSGSPPDLCWNVSGDGSVTSLDALMILQAAAHAIDL